jgi:hypothetical protein
MCGKNDLGAAGASVLVNGKWPMLQNISNLRECRAWLLSILIAPQE